jgi:hypothetical protein
LRRFFASEDIVYDQYESAYQAKTPFTKAIYFFISCPASSPSCVSTMKKSAFLGKLNWIVNSGLFALYHLWQVQQTWPMIGLVLAFGLLMALRKDLYVLVAFHMTVPSGDAWRRFTAVRFLTRAPTRH